MDTFVLSSLSSRLNFLWIVWRAGNTSKHCMQMWAFVYMCAETRALTLGSFSVVLHITFWKRNSHSICTPIGETSWPVSCRHSPTSVPLREGVPSTLQSPAFNVGVRDLSSGSHTCAQAFYIEPSPPFSFSLRSWLLLFSSYSFPPKGFSVLRNIQMLPNNIFQYWNKSLPLWCPLQCDRSKS